MENDPNGKKLIEEQKESNADALKGASIADLVNPESRVYQAPPEKPREKTPLPEKVQFDAEGFPIIPTLRTYQEDVAHAVQSDNLTLTQIAMAEQNRTRNSNAENTSATTSAATARVHLIIGIVSTLLFVSGVGAVAFSFFHKKPPVVAVASPHTIIPAEENINLDITTGNKRQIVGNILSEATARLPKDQTVRNVIPVIRQDNVFKKASLSQFFTAFESRLPDGLSRSLDQDNYMVGIDFSGKGEPFIMVSPSSYDVAYAGLLDWEGLMKDDLAPLFAPQLISTKSYNFTDRTVLNHDTRSLEDAHGNIAFFYSIVDSNIIVFAKTQSQFKDILDRIRDAKLQ